MFEHSQSAFTGNGRDGLPAARPGWIPISQSGYQLSDVMRNFRLNAKPNAKTNWISPWQGPSEHHALDALPVRDVGLSDQSRDFYKPSKAVLVCYASNGLGLVDQKIFNCLSWYAGNHNPAEDGPVRYRTRAAFLRRDIGLGARSDNRQIRRGLERLCKERIAFPLIRDQATGEPVLGTMIEKFRLDPRSGVLEWTFPPDLMPNPSRSKPDKSTEPYTVLDISVCAKLSSKYALRLYELICMLQKRRHRIDTFSVEQLRHLLGAQSLHGTCLNDWHDFSKRALNPGLIDEINEVSGLAAEMTVIKSPITKRAESVRFELPKRVTME